MTKAVVVILALPFACYSAGDGDSQDAGGGAGEDSTGGTLSGSSGTGGSAVQGGAAGRGGVSGNGGRGGSAGALAGSAGVAGNPSAGTGGGGGSSGSAGEGASSGTGGSGTVGGTLGQACSTDAECGTDPFICISNDEFDGAGPPKGLCTTSCSNDTVCTELSPGALCVEFPDGQSYCIEGCQRGNGGEPKCNEREEFGCGIVGVIPGSITCSGSESCSAGQFCSEGICSDPITACVPVCSGDYNCGEGQYCDYASGFCVTGEAEGLPIGAACDPSAVEDPCRGFCVAVSDSDGMCSADCTVNSSALGCGFDGTSAADAVCVWVPLYADPADVGAGDTLFCGATCDCNEECFVPGWGCFAADPILGAGAAEFYGRPGVCTPMAATDTLEDTLGACPDTGTGGAGGIGGEGGEPSTGGVPGSDSGGGAGQEAMGGGGSGGPGMSEP